MSPLEGSIMIISEEDNYTPLEGYVVENAPARGGGSYKKYPSRRAIRNETPVRRAEKSAALAGLSS